MGGGTGTFTVLSGLKKYPVNLSAIIAMSDDGGSTGILRDELGVLPPGDIRQCLVALSASPLFLRQLMNYRFTDGGLKGHNFGNLFLSALQKTTGSFDAAVQKASEVLRIQGKVIPATLQRISLVATLENGKKVRGQSMIHNTNLMHLADISLLPRARANPKALHAIREADAIVIGPGDLYSSLIPNLLVSGIPQAVRKSTAKKIYVANLMTKREHTHGFSVADYVGTLETFLRGKVTHVIWNNRAPSPLLIKRYAKKGELPVARGEKLTGRVMVEANLVSKKIIKTAKGDPIPRTLIRHDPDRLGKIILGIAHSHA